MDDLGVAQECRADVRRNSQDRFCDRRDFKKITDKNQIKDLLKSSSKQEIADRVSDGED